MLKSTHSEGVTRMLTRLRFTTPIRRPLALKRLRPRPPLSGSERCGVNNAPSRRTTLRVDLELCLFYFEREV